MCSFLCLIKIMNNFTAHQSFPIFMHVVLFMLFFIFFFCYRTHIEQLIFANWKGVSHFGSTSYIKYTSNTLIPLGYIWIHWNIHSSLQARSNYKGMAMFLIHELYFSIHSQICRVQCIWKFNTLIKYLNLSHKYFIFHEICRA